MVTGVGNLKRFSRANNSNVDALTRTISRNIVLCNQRRHAANTSNFQCNVTLISRQGNKKGKKEDKKNTMRLIKRKGLCRGTKSSHRFHLRINYSNEVTSGHERGSASLLKREHVSVFLTKPIKTFALPLYLQREVNFSTIFWNEKRLVIRLSKKKLPVIRMKRKN